MGKCCGKTCRLVTMLILRGLLFLAEILVFYFTNSVEIFGNSLHVLADMLALIVSLTSVKISKWCSSRNTYGWVRAEIVGAVVNAVFLLAICFSIFIEGLRRFLEPEAVENPTLFIIIGVAGLLINGIGLVLFHNYDNRQLCVKEEQKANGCIQQTNGKEPLRQYNMPLDSVSMLNSNWAKEDGHCTNCHLADHGLDTDEDMTQPKISSSSKLNMRAVFLHMLGDFMMWVIVIVSAIVIKYGHKDWVNYIDPAMSLVMVCIIVVTTIPLLKEAALVLLLTVPTHIRVKHILDNLTCCLIPGIGMWHGYGSQVVQGSLIHIWDSSINTDLKNGAYRQFTGMDGILSVSNFHLWQLEGETLIASAHIQCHNPQEYMTLARNIKDMFHNAGIHSTTIQPEFTESSSLSSNGALKM